MNAIQGETKSNQSSSIMRGGTRRILRSVLLVTATSLVFVSSFGAKPASADTFIAGNRLSSGGSCALGPSVLYSTTSGNQGYAQQVRVWTQVYGGSTTVTPWSTAAPATTLGIATGYGAPRGTYYAQYLEYRQYNVAVRGWYSGGEWVPKTSGIWCRA